MIGPPFITGGPPATTGGSPSCPRPWLPTATSGHRRLAFGLWQWGYLTLTTSPGGPDHLLGHARARAHAGAHARARTGARTHARTGARTCAHEQTPCQLKVGTHFAGLFLGTVLARAHAAQVKQCGQSRNFNNHKGLAQFDTLRHPNATLTSRRFCLGSRQLVRIPHSVGSDYRNMGATGRRRNP